MNFPVAAIEAPRALRLPARGSLSRLAILPLAALAVTTLAMHVFGISGGDDPAHLHKIALLHKDPYGFMVFAASAAGACTLRFDLARTAEAELRQ